MQKVEFIKSSSDTFQKTEAIKNLRTNLQFCGADIRVIMLTSTFPGEGKSSTSIELAKSFAELGKRTVFVDCDLRKSVSLSWFTSDERLYGLTHFLSGMQNLENCICETDVPNLHILFPGVCPPNPVELFNTKRFSAMINALKEHYSFVIIDTPPMANVVDAAVLSQYCDGSVFVISQGNVRYRLAQKMIEQLGRSGSKVLGVTFNKVDSKQNYLQKSYYGRFYGKKYGKYGGYGNYGRSDRNSEEEK
jgi:capsular exopolysaccharide synthesis family protein